MENRCETIGKYLLPFFRSSVAKELVVTHGLTQKQASEILGTTQAAISQYINSKRAIKGGNEFVHMLPKIQETARQTADQLAKKQIAWREVTAKRRLKGILETTVQNIAAFVSGNRRMLFNPNQRVNYLWIVKR